MPEFSMKWIYTNGINMAHDLDLEISTSSTIVSYVAIQHPFSREIFAILLLFSHCCVTEHSSYLIL